MMLLEGGATKLDEIDELTKLLELILGEDAGPGLATDGEGDGFEDFAADEAGVGEEDFVEEDFVLLVDDFDETSDGRGVQEVVESFIDP